MGTLYDTGIEPVALRSFEVMATGDLDDFVGIIHLAFVNDEAIDEPPAARVEYGPDACHATALWLREAFADLRGEVHEMVTERLRTHWMRMADGTMRAA